MPSYQGRALRSEAPRRRGARSRVGRVLKVLGVLGALAALAHVPWGELKQRMIRISEIRVAGLHYLDAETVAARSGLEVGSGWLDADLDRARQRLLADSRIRAATLSRALPNAIQISIEERVPVLLVRHGSPWELDAD